MGARGSRFGPCVVERFRTNAFGDMARAFAKDRQIGCTREWCSLFGLRLRHLDSSRSSCPRANPSRLVRHRATSLAQRAAVWRLTIEKCKPPQQQTSSPQPQKTPPPKS